MVERHDALTGEWISKEMLGIRGVIEGAGMESAEEQRDFMLARARERIEDLEKRVRGSNFDSPGMQQQIADLKRAREGIRAERSEEERAIRGYERDNGLHE